MTAFVARGALFLILVFPVGQLAAKPAESTGVTGFPVSMSVWKTANPAFVVSGTVVIFRLGVFNTSAQDSITITNLQDDVFGDLDGQGDCALPQQVAPGNSYSCTFPAVVTGAVGSDHSDTITVTAIDAQARVINESDSTAVGLVAAAVAVGTAELSNVALTGAVAEPGAMVTMRVDIFNTGSANVTIDSLIDSVYGDLNGQGSCSLPQIVPQNPDSGVYTCTYPAFVGGLAGTVQSNTLTASGMDSSGNPISGIDTTSVQIVAGRPTSLSAAIAVPGLNPLALLFTGLLLAATGRATMAGGDASERRNRPDRH